MSRVRFAACTAAIAIACVSTRASAEDSAEGPIYVHGGLGVSYLDFPRVAFGPFTTGYSWAGFRPEIEAGFHFSGRHDGFVLAIRQSFVITELGLGGAASGMTAVRGGWDLAFKAGAFEINVDPFATVGIGYIFDGPHAGISATGGLDVKLFFVDAFYAFARPGELGIQCFHDSGNCAFSYAASVGAGVAFGGK